jgi:carbon-monoxide dehydrogenase medium subunit
MTLPRFAMILDSCRSGTCTSRSSRVRIPPPVIVARLLTADRKEAGVKPAVFDYYAPTSRDELLGLLGQLGDDARVLAGGQSLIPLMNFRLSQPAQLVDVGTVPDLAYVRANGGVHVGAGARQWDVEHDPQVAAQVPLLAEALHHVAHPPIRHRGTVCGSIAHADPAAELPAVALALDATMRVASAGGTREVAAKDFFRGVFATALGPGELLEEVFFPALPAGTGFAVAELARTHGNFAVAGAMATMRLGEAGAVESCALVAFGLGPTAFRCEAGEGVLAGAQPSQELFAEAAAAATASLEPPADMHGSAQYRKRVAAVYMERAIAEAHARAAGGQAHE